TIARRLGQPVALKAEAPGLLHKSDLGCVKLNCKTESEVVAGYEAVVASANVTGYLLKKSRRNRQISELRHTAVTKLIGSYATGDRRNNCTQA
ncbi:MAG: acetate--CoA ligase family protein, partial [Pseudomonadota bacterium]